MGSVSSSLVDGPPSPLPPDLPRMRYIAVPPLPREPRQAGDTHLIYVSLPGNARPASIMPDRLASAGPTVIGGGDELQPGDHPDRDGPGHAGRPGLPVRGEHDHVRRTRRAVGAGR